MSSVEKQVNREEFVPTVVIATTGYDHSRALSATKLPEEIVNHYPNCVIPDGPGAWMFTDFDDVLSHWQDAGVDSPEMPGPTWILKESDQSSLAADWRYDAVSGQTEETLWSYTRRTDLDAHWVLENSSGRHAETKYVPDIAAAWGLSHNESARGQELELNGHLVLCACREYVRFAPLEFFMLVPGLNPDESECVRKIGHFQPRNRWLGCPAQSGTNPGTFAFDLPADFGESEIVALIIAALRMIDWRVTYSANRNSDRTRSLASVNHSPEDMDFVLRSYRSRIRSEVWGSLINPEEIIDLFPRLLTQILTTAPLSGVERSGGEDDDDDLELDSDGDWDGADEVYDTSFRLLQLRDEASESDTDSDFTPEPVMESSAEASAPSRPAGPRLRLGDLIGNPISGGNLSGFGGSSGRHR